MTSSPLGSHGESIARVGFGCAGLMRVPEADTRQRLLETAYEAGIRHFDVARMYGLGAAEGELGRFARSRRDSITIATKFGIEPAAATARLGRFQGPLRRAIGRFPTIRRAIKRRGALLDRPHRYDAASARASLERSLRELGTDYVDIFFLHGPSPRDPIDFDELGGFLEEVRAAGQIRAWGISGEASSSLTLRARFSSPAVLQVKSDIFAPFAQPLDPPSALILFGILARALSPIRDHVQSSAQTVRRWSEEIGQDCAQPAVLASLLLADALDSPAEIALYGTSSAAHLTETLERWRAHDGDALAAFRALVGRELPPRTNSAAGLAR